ncbi:TPA: GDSL-type esterase/lipase family protein [Klebsiella pneumoniae]
MSVPSQTPYNIYTANGLTTVFAYQFMIMTAGDLDVSVNGTSIASGFTVQGAGQTGGGQVVFAEPPANGAIVTLLRKLAIKRDTDYQDNGDLLAETINADFDRLWLAMQQSFLSDSLSLKRPLLGGPYNAGGLKIINLQDPTNPQDAATKGWVDRQYSVPTSEAKEAAAEAKEARDETREIADKFGDVDGAISAAEDARDRAEVAAGDAGVSAEQAQHALESAEAVVDTENTFNTVADGLANTPSGKFFRVPQGNAMNYYLNNSGVAVLVFSLDNHDNIIKFVSDALTNLYRYELSHCKTTPKNTTDSVSSSWLIFPERMNTGLLPLIELYLASSGTVYVATFSKAGDVFNKKRFTAVNGIAGYGKYRMELIVDDGDYIGVYTQGGLYYDTAATISDEVYRWASTTPATDTSLPVNAATGQYPYTFQARVTALRGAPLSIATDALNTQAIGVTSRFDNLVGYSRAGDGNRMFMLKTPVKLAGVVTGVTYIANNPTGTSQTVRALVYRLSGGNYNLVDSQVIVTNPVDGAVNNLSLYLNVQAGDYLVFSAPCCFDSLNNFGANFADSAYAIYSPSDSTIPSSIPAASFVSQTSSALFVRFGVSYLAGDAEHDKSVKNALISRMLTNTDGVYLSAARSIVIDIEGVNGTANAIYVPRALTYSSLAEQRSITLGNSLAVENIRGPYSKITFSNLDFRDLRANYRLIYIDLKTNTLKAVNGISGIPAVNALPVIEIYGRADEVNWRVFGGLSVVRAQRPKAGDILADVYDAITNPERDASIGFIGNSITWGMTVTGIGPTEPRSHSLSDARNNFTSRTWVNLFRRWSAELACHAKNQSDNQPTGLSTYANDVKIEVNGPWRRFTPVDPGTELLTQTRAETLRQYGGIRAIDVLPGRSMSFKFTGSAITLVHATLKNMDADIYVDGVLKASVVTDDSAVIAFGTTLEISGLLYGDHILKIVCAETAGDNFRLQYLVRSKRHAVMNSGISGTNTSEWLPGGSLLVPAALPENVSHIFIQLGTNDRGMSAGGSTVAGAQGTEINLNTIVTSLRSSYPGVGIILIAPPYAPNDGTQGSSDEVARAVRRTAQTLQCGFIDQYSATLELEMSGDNWLNSDQLHPNDLGHRVMFKNLQTAIVSAGSR